MVCIRRATPADLPAIETCSYMCLAETHRFPIYAEHLLWWPQLAYVAEDHRNKIVGYLLGTIIDPGTKRKQNLQWRISDNRFGKTNFLAVMRPYRKMGIATKLIEAAHEAFYYVFGVGQTGVRVSAINREALIFFNKMGYKLRLTMPDFHGNGEDALVLVKQL